MRRLFSLLLISLLLAVTLASPDTCPFGPRSGSVMKDRGCDSPGDMCTATCDCSISKSASAKCPTGRTCTGSAAASVQFGAGPSGYTLEECSASCRACIGGHCSSGGGSGQMLCSTTPQKDFAGTKTLSASASGSVTVKRRDRVSCWILCSVSVSCWCSGDGDGGTPPSEPSSELRVKTNIDDTLQRAGRCAIRVNGTYVETWDEDEATFEDVSYAELEADTSFTIPRYEEKRLEDCGSFRTRSFNGAVKFAVSFYPEYTEGFEHGILRIYAEASDYSRRLLKEFSFEGRSPKHFELTATMHDERFYVEAWYCKMRSPSYTAEWNETYVFSWWGVYDGDDNLVNFTRSPRTEVTVDPGATIKAVAYYNETPPASLTVLSQPPGVVISYSGTHSGSRATPFVIPGPLNVTLEAPENIERRLLVFNSSVDDVATRVSERPGVYEVGVDGCGRLGVFLHVALPLSKPGLAALGTIAFLSNWNSFMWPLIVIYDREKMTLPLGLATFQGLYSTEWTLLMAASTMALLPLIIVYVANQRFFTRGIQLGGLRF